MISQVDPYQIIEKYYKVDSKCYQILVTHSEMVAQKALDISDTVSELAPDRRFIWEAAMLHDIGICFVNAPGLDCFGLEHYLRHGLLGSQLLREEENLPIHALVCERHTGVGITKKDVDAQNLPLPSMDYLPLSLEEKIICFADNFFSKNPSRLKQEKSPEQIRKSLKHFGQEKVEVFDEWMLFFKLES